MPEIDGSRYSSKELAAIADELRRSIGENPAVSDSPSSSATLGELRGRIDGLEISQASFVKQASENFLDLKSDIRALANKFESQRDSVAASGRTDLAKLIGTAVSVGVLMTILVGGYIHSVEGPIEKEIAENKADFRAFVSENKADLRSSFEKVNLSFEKTNSAFDKILTREDAFLKSTVSKDEFQEEKRNVEVRLGRTLVALDRVSDDKLSKSAYDENKARVDQVLGRQTEDSRRDIDRTDTNVRNEIRSIRDTLSDRLNALNARLIEMQTAFGSSATIGDVLKNLNSRLDQVQAQALRAAEAAAAAGHATSVYPTLPH